MAHRSEVFVSSITLKSSNLENKAGHLAWCNFSYNLYLGKCFYITVGNNFVSDFFFNSSFFLSDIILSELACHAGLVTITLRYMTDTHTPAYPPQALTHTHAHIYETILRMYLPNSTVTNSMWHTLLDLLSYQGKKLSLSNYLMHQR